VTPAGTATAAVSARGTQLAEVGRLATALGPGRKGHSPLDPGGPAVGAGGSGIPPQEKLEVLAALETFVFVDRHCSRFYG
jgi:hypothetical protein